MAIAMKRKIEKITAKWYNVDGQTEKPQAELLNWPGLNWVLRPPIQSESTAGVNGRARADQTPSHHLSRLQQFRIYSFDGPRLCHVGRAKVGGSP
jgi:hypothetical protein